MQAACERIPPVRGAGTVHSPVSQAPGVSLRLHKMSATAPLLPGSIISKCAVWLGCERTKEAAVVGNVIWHHREKGATADAAHQLYPTPYFQLWQKVPFHPHGEHWFKKLTWFLHSELDVPSEGISWSALLYRDSYSVTTPCPALLIK
ncbi:hypothetical protein QQF64_005698 [Cirrhinus molitorella]|uniref:Uncharacterized protein n=1 Tax=Cirrhinus molitorella TaxID=172907 RepID=A0ABR3MG53_9TELE